MACLPIENYGVIGNMRTAALVGTNGSLDWLCLPQFDSPSVFAAILDENKGGWFRISPKPETIVKTKQFYWADTNILVTRFFTGGAVGEVVDFMPAGEDRGLVRHVRSIRGRITFEVECRPAFNYARDAHDLELDANGARFHAPGLTVTLAAHCPLVSLDGAAVGEVALDTGESCSFLMTSSVSRDAKPEAFSEETSKALFDEAANYWRSWIEKSTYRGRWREIVHRSALMLKLLVFEPTGAIVAAPTCSLPEVVGGERNWDYRFTWIRDAAFTVYALMRIGFTQEASSFMGWLQARCRELEPDGSLQVLYRIDGGHELAEEVAVHLDGYRGSAPVRIGNGAAHQLQLDIYGELMDSVYLYNKHVNPISFEFWQYLRRMTNWVCENWDQPDEGIWEVRSGRQKFVYSRMMCWVALDRALRLANKRSFPADFERWTRVRDEIYMDIQQNGWSTERNAFIQHYGSESLDASLLMMPLVFFLSPVDPRMIRTLHAIDTPREEGGLVSGGLVYRYNEEEAPDGLRGQEGTFNMCSFFLVEALTRAGRVNPEYLEQARMLFEQMLGNANHLGLFSEQTGPGGEALGNFPQALTHLALISAAYNLDLALGEAGRASAMR
jgi:GH15 family glucan-1,4-alpha-glucosidase